MKNKAAIGSLVISVIAMVAFPALFDVWRRLPPAVRMRFHIDIITIAALLVVGIYLGIYALIPKHACREKPRGRVLAIVGVLISVSVAWSVLLPAITNRRIFMAEKTQVICASNLKQMSTALLSYSQDYDGYLPPASKWNGVVRIGQPDILICPSSGSDRPSYALNRALIGVDLSKLGNPGDVVMLFECEPGENRVGGSEIASYPHSDGCNVAYADGHVKWYAKSMAEKVMARKPKIESKITSTRAPSD